MQTNLEKVKSSINKSSLSDHDKNDLVEIFSIIDDEHLAGLARILSDNPSWISKLNSNLNVKRAVLEAKDSRLWQRILDEEVSELNGLQDK